MNALIVLIPVTLVLVSFAVGLFIWAARHDQFHNLDTPGILPVMDVQNDEPDETSENSSSSTSIHPKKEVSS